MYANRAIPRILLRRLYHVAPTNDSGERDEYRESHSKVNALYPKPFAVVSDRLNEIAGGAPADHFVLCGHIPRIGGRSDCNADLFERAGNRIFEVTENFCTQCRGIGFLSADEEQAPPDDHDKYSEAGESDPFVDLRWALVERDRGENEQRREYDPERGVDRVHSPRLVGV
jgi:hypothetical protein